MRTSVIGGEEGHRGFLSGRRSKTELGVALGAVALWLVLMNRFGMWGFFIGIIILGVVLIGLRKDADGQPPWHGWVKKGRMAQRRRSGTDDFIPYDLIPDEDRNLDVSGLTRRERKRKYKELAAYRDVPDGVEGLSWVRQEAGATAVAKHVPTGEEPYLSVVFAVDGPVQGLHGDEYISRAQYRFGQLLAGWGASSKLVSGIQMMTRVIPVDSAKHEAWMQSQLDEDVDDFIIASYQSVLDELGQSSFVQRHFAVVRFNLTPAFGFASSRRGSGEEGWLTVIDEQVESALRRFREAMFTGVHSLSGPQVAAVLRHLQHPDWPIDRASDVTPETCWFPSHDEWSHTEVVGEYPDRYDPDVFHEQTSWYHRTAWLPPAAFEQREVDGLFLSPLLIGLSDQIVRTIATHLHLIPARISKSRARSDHTADQAERHEQARKGRIMDDDMEMAATASARRVHDLSNGSGHHGTSWGGFITISARSVEELREASVKVEESADSAGISRLLWEDTFQSAAAASTWPVMRGVVPEKDSFLSSVKIGSNSGSSKEALT